jgi:hypothetical protein
MNDINLYRDAANRLRLDDDFDIRGRLFSNNTISFADQDATPSVGSGNFFQTANTVATTITDFDDGVVGQRITVLINDANTTIDFTGTNLKGNAGADWSPANGDYMVCDRIGTTWYCNVIDAT